MFLAEIRQEEARGDPCGDLHSSGDDGVLHKLCLKGVGGGETGWGTGVARPIRRESCAARTIGSVWMRALSLEAIMSITFQQDDQ